MEPGELIVLARAAELHDIGKVAIPDIILDKPGPLTDEEWAFMRQHTIIGERILSSAPALARVAQIVRSSHEHFDGSGYPGGLAGDAIPLSARVILACDAYEAMTSDRPYASALSDGEARAELLRCSGTQFDPHVVETLLGVLDADQVPPIVTSLGVEAQTA
jgi:HD-GYP domain-containing protein (c-di-GMP phosphodiesterase class II)